jgi:hypothetical protein
MIATTQRTASTPLMILTMFSSKAFPPQLSDEIDLVLYLIGWAAANR